ncbi:MAG: type I-C CRISPR-associated protein Cas8c/Csd1 [Planctomycetes bacterium]|nr:type I-C CRISPR-associated protein Cas8c/Csd1 [Planctomycetota bacterium]
MILQELCKYYDRLIEDPEEDVAPKGNIVQGIAFEVVIDETGSLIGIHDLREAEGKIKRNKRMVLPGKAKPTGSGINPSLHGWDRTDYMLGYLNPETLKGDEKTSKLSRCEKAHSEYKRRMLEMERAVDHTDYSAFCKFLRWWKAERADEYAILKEVSGLFGVVRFSGKNPRYLHEMPQLRNDDEDSKSVINACLVTGELTSIARTHDIKIKGVSGAQSSGAAIVSFNLDAFESYGRKQSFNAPISEDATFKYATALNKLLERDSKRRIQIGDTTCVFWADAPCKGEDLFGFGLSGARAEDEAKITNLSATLKSIQEGIARLPDAETGFHVLGLSPNASRLSVRFWYSSTIGEMIERILNHQRDLSIVHDDKYAGLIPAWRILAQTARESKDIPPLLSGALLCSILADLRYPQALYAAIIRRIRADRWIDPSLRGDDKKQQAQGRSASHIRAAMIKATLCRNYNKEGLEMLNPERPEAAYQIGRLFAALEKAQEDALPGINATVKDRYFGAASATPGIVFPRLIRMSQHHIGKMEGGRKVIAEKRIQEICGHILEFPAHLDLIGQGLFALGYYHQRQDLYTKKSFEPEAGESV